MNMDRHKGGPRHLGLFAIAVVQGCAPSDATHDPLVSELFADEIAIIDLTHTVSANAPFWPGPAESPFLHDTIAAHSDGAPIMASYAVPEHFGTHFDAPVHGGIGLSSVDRVPTTDLFGPAVVIDVTQQATANPDYAATQADIEAWEAEYGRIPDGAVVLLRSGWAERWTEGDAYYNQDGNGQPHFPGFAVDAARFLVSERRIAGIGVDTGSVDPGNADGFPVHGIVNGSGHFHLENLASLSDLPSSGAYLIVAPIKIEGGSGGQVRVFGVVP